MAVKNIANIMIAMYMEIQIASIASSLLISCLPFGIKAARLHASCVAREHRQGNDGDGYRDVYKKLDHHFAHHVRTLPFCVSIVIHSRGDRGSYSKSEFRVDRFFRTRDLAFIRPHTI